MLVQRSKKLHKHIQTDGCALMSAAYFVNQYRLRDMPPEHINRVYLDGLHRGYMRERSYMADWQKVFHELGLDARYLGHKAADWTPAEDEFEVLLYYYAPHNWWHFVCGDGLGRPTYDPWGSAGPGFRGAKTVALGSLHSKRGFRLNGSR
jgi:hypothetical protein